MKAAVFREMGRPMEIEDVAIAKPIGREVLVRIAAVGVCHSDLHIMTGDLPHPRDIDTVAAQLAQGRCAQRVVGHRACERAVVAESCQRHGDIGLGATHMDLQSV